MVQALTHKASKDSLQKSLFVLMAMWYSFGRAFNTKGSI